MEKRTLWQRLCRSPGSIPVRKSLLTGEKLPMVGVVAVRRGAAREMLGNIAKDRRARALPLQK